MDELVLTLSVQFLGAKDAFAASSVSSEWRALLAGDRNNGGLWKQVFANSFPLLVDSNGSDDEDLDYRLLTFGLWDGITPKAPTSQPVLSPTVGADNFFAIVELFRYKPAEQGNERPKEVFVLWKCPVSVEGGLLAAKEVGEDETQAQHAALKGVNPWSQAQQNSAGARRWRENAKALWSSPLEYALRTIVRGTDFYQVEIDPSGRWRRRSLRLSVTLFRRDSMKSVRLLDGELYDEAVEEFSGNMSKGYIEWFVINSPALSMTEAGVKARSMMYDDGCTGFMINGTFNLYSKLSDDGSVPVWVTNCIRALENGQKYVPDRQDRATLASISHFEYSIESFRLRWTKWNPDNRDHEEEPFQNEDEMLIALEGLCWE